MRTDGKEDGAVVFLGKLYNIVPGKYPFAGLLQRAVRSFTHLCETAAVQGDRTGIVALQLDIHAKLIGLGWRV